MAHALCVIVYIQRALASVSFFLFEILEGKHAFSFVKFILLIIAELINV